ncbi:hypothetical protein [Cesiribacter sp. SM1]|uniref:hypothetical protein n=1 Tax=Cesiribacter sp. SM1 TaxID=2861196 RepID=UPI001CD71DF8|nr:hypothetical protein [Cesiribacter sp. SM1]
MEITSKPNRIIFILGIIISFLILANIAGMVARFSFGYESSYLIELFNLDKENNIPTYFSSLLLLGCAATLGIVAFLEKERKSGKQLYWMGLSFIFLLLSIDESVQIHERIGAWTQNTLQTSGVFHFAWIIPYGLLVLVIGAAYTRFVWNLPLRIKKLMILSGAIYVGGALGMEALASYHYTQTFENSLTLVVFTIIEESMELTGLLLFLRSLLYYVDAEFGGVAFRLTSRGENLISEANELLYERKGAVNKPRLAK